MMPDLPIEECWISNAAPNLKFRSALEFRSPRESFLYDIEQCDRGQRASVEHRIKKMNVPAFSPPDAGGFLSSELAASQGH
jgi:hypothetical protein